MTRARLLVLGVAGLLGAAGSALGDAPSKRKPASDKFTRAAGEAFAAATAADQKGDLKAALGLYQKAYEISPHPSTAYNIADVQRRLGQLELAIRSFETYLALAPAAADRRDVEAVIDQIARTPATLWLVTEPPSDPDAVDWASAYILVDGEIKARPGTTARPIRELSETGIAVEVRAGAHRVDIVTPLTYGSNVCVPDPGQRRRCKLTTKPRIDGRLVISSPERHLAVRADRAGPSLVNERTEQSPGRRKLLVRDRRYECAPIVADIPPGASDVAYLFVSTDEYEFERCRALRVVQHKLSFAP